MLNFYLQLLLILFGATALACWCGWGLARLALPASLRPYGALLAPLLGYAFAMVLGYWFVWTVSGLAPALLILLLATGALNALAWRREGPPRLGAIREELPILLIAFVTLLVGIAPLLHYGHPAVIGGGWDIETALPTARYLERGPIAAIADAAPNPLRDLVRDPPRIGKTVGFAVWQGSLDILTHIEAILTFTPLLAWLRALGVLVVYVLLRATLGLRRGPALLGAALSSAGALLLWIGYFNFEKQMAAWPLIPLGLLVGVAAVEELAKPTKDQRPNTKRRASDRWSLVLGPWSRLGMALLAAITLAALPVAYYPALTLWVPLAAGLATAILVERALTPQPPLPLRQEMGGDFPSPVVMGAGPVPALSADEGVRAIPRLLLAAIALAGLTSLVAAPTILDYWHGFAYRYNEQLTTLGVFFYIPATDILGLTPYLHGQPEPAAMSPWALGGLAAFGVLALAGLLLPATGDWRLGTRSTAANSQSPVPSPQSPVPNLRWWGMLLGALIYLAWLRWWQQYPYAYLKGAAYAGFVFMGLAAAGWQALAERASVPWLRLGSQLNLTAKSAKVGITSTTSPSRPLRSGRLETLIGVIGVAAPLLLAIPMVISQARIVAMHWDGPGLYPADFPALLELRQRIEAGSSVTLADDGRTEGVISGLAAYMLDHTTVWGRVKTGYTSAATGAPDAIGEYALLPIGEDPTLYGYGAPIWRGGSYALYQRPPGALAQLRPEYILAPGQSIALAAGVNHLALGAESQPAGPPRRLDLTVAALHESTIGLDGKNFAIPAGGARVRIATLPIGPPHEIRNSGAEPILLRSATLAEAGESTADAVTPLRSALVTSAGATAAEQTVTTRIETLLADGGPLTLALDIWDRGRAIHYGWYGVELGTSPGIQTTTLNLDLRRGELRATTGEGAPVPSGAQFAGLQAGDYSARLQVSAGAAALAGSGDLFTFSVGEDQAISDIRTEPLPFLVTTTDRPPHLLGFQLGDDMRLQGYAIDKTIARPGDSLLLTLWWQALAAPGDERSVLVQLLDRGGAIVAQADGPPAHGGRPTSQWQAGDTVIDSRQVRLPADLPNGAYTLVFGMYRWPSL
ncbi:MAG TPA: hypothetical protein VKE41_00395, partial [Roseiflexaceae bacterium]|nr:hypothetical protein [Roseiflexaceae bacterium]